RVPVPDGLPEETIARTLTALQHAAVTKAIPSKRRKIMHLTMSLAAALMTAAGGFFFSHHIPPLEAPLAFAEVAQKLRDAHTLAYQGTAQSAHVNTPVTMQMYIKE